ncbi:uncharacterized protein [Fopius arisanus]|uniref:Endonuclease/exonuclease/phosphatase domain-containing protein n=1 Tax=Fopius arisanus TaxID=64838 RepID=A0A9R1TZM8_9HYME|nr:PREDICTED: uncharacterized protein LOC105266043 [Fopius arisanus]
MARVKDEGTELLLGCNANSHHLGWGSSNTNARREALHDFMMVNDLLLLKRGTEPTLTNCRKQEVLDITICTRNPKKTDWTGYKEELSLRIQDVPSRFENEERLEYAGEAFGESITSSFETNCVMRAIKGTKQVSWWSTILANLRDQVRRAWNKVKNSCSNLCRRKAAEKRKLLQEKFNKALAKARRERWKKFSSGIENLSEASRLVKLLGGQGVANQGYLLKPDSNYTWTSEESLQLLLEEHFPGFTGTESAKEAAKETRNRYKSQDWALSAEIVYPQVVKSAMKFFEPREAPGPDGIYPVLLQREIHVIVGPLTKILRASVGLRTVLRVWGESKIVSLPKPGPNGYIKRRNFRPISLTSFVLKILERLVDRYIKITLLIARPLCSAQYAYREGSTETSLQHLVAKVEEEEKSHWHRLGLEPKDQSMAVQDGSAATADVRSCGLVARGKEGGDKEPAQMPTGKFPDTHGYPENSPGPTST